MINSNIETLSSHLSDGLNYFLIFLLFFVVITGTIIIIMFAKWLTVGPKLKRKWHKWTRKEDKTHDGVTIKGGQVIIDEEYMLDIDEKIKNANTPQELLEFQILKENHEKQKIKALEEIKQKEESKLSKIQDKETRKKLSAEANAEAKKLKQIEKENIKKMKEGK